MVPDDLLASSAPSQLFSIPNRALTVSRSSARPLTASTRNSKPPPGFQIDPLISFDPLNLIPNLLPDLPCQYRSVIVVEFCAHAAAEGEPRLLREGGCGAVGVGAGGRAGDEVEVDVWDDLGGAGTFW